MSAQHPRLKYLVVLFAIALSALGVWMLVQHKQSGTTASGTFIADNEFVVEIEHDTAGIPVDVSTFGPVPEGQSCEQYETIIDAGAEKNNPPGFRSQTTCLHVRFRGPLGIHGAVISQPTKIKPLGWALIAVAYSRMGAYIGAQTLHATPDIKTCDSQAHDIIDSNVKDGTIHSGWSVLIYCLPEPPLPTKDTLPNGDGII